MAEAAAPPTPWREGYERLARRVEATAAEALDGFPHFADPRTGAWTVSPDGDWTGGFWVGALWLAAHGTREASDAERARDWARRLVPRAGSDTAFRGFLFYYGAVLGAVLAQDATAVEIALAGARALARSFNAAAGLIPLGDDAEEASDVGRGETSIDTVAGAALLLWAARESGEPSLTDTAVAHARRHVEFCVRADGSVCQSASFNPASGELVRRYTHKGLHANSTWTRAQAWAMVGYAVMAIWTGEPDFVRVGEQTADWWIAHVPADRVALWDFDAREQDGAAKDTSGTAIAASALLKLAALTRDPARAERYRAEGEAAVAALLDGYLDERGILSHGCYSPRIELATCNELIWGSYYLFEALSVLNGLLDPTTI